MARILEERRAGPIQLDLFAEGDAARLRVLVNLGAGASWEGSASFPVGTLDEARDLVAGTETPTDIEDIIRMWGDEETWASWQEFRNLHGV
jgi:hypothetical protein